MLLRLILHKLVVGIVEPNDGVPFTALGHLLGLFYITSAFVLEGTLQYQSLPLA